VSFQHLNLKTSECVHRTVDVAGLVMGTVTLWWFRVSGSGKMKRGT